MQEPDDLREESHYENKSRRRARAGDLQCSTKAGQKAEDDLYYE